MAWRNRTEHPVLTASVLQALMRFLAVVWVSERVQNASFLGRTLLVTSCIAVFKIRVPRTTSIERPLPRLNRGFIELTRTGESSPTICFTRAECFFPSLHHQTLSRPPCKMEGVSRSTKGSIQMRENNGVRSSAIGEITGTRANWLRTYSTRNSALNVELEAKAVAKTDDADYELLRR